MNKEVLKQLADAFKMKESDLEAALGSETGKIELSGTLYSDSDLETLRKNVKKQSYDEGFIASREMLVKDFAKKNSIDAKDFDSAIELYVAAKLKDAGKTFEEKDTIISKLRADLTDKEKTILDVEERSKSIILNAKIESTLSKLSLNYTTAEALALMNANGIEAIEENGKLIAKKDGEVARGKMQDPIDLESYMRDFSKSKGWTKTEEPPAAGRGADKTEPGAKVSYKNVSALRESFLKDGKDINGKEYQVALIQHSRAASAAGVDFFTEG